MHTENPTSIFMGHYHPCLGWAVIKWTSDYNDTMTLHALAGHVSLLQ